MLWTDAQLFKSIPAPGRKDFFAAFSRCVKRHQAKAGTTILRAGEVPQHLILVESGVLRSVHYTGTGEELSAFYYPPGSSVFHIACVTRKPVQSYCMAVQDTQFVTVPQGRYMEFLDSFPAFERALLLYICETSEHLIEHAVTVQMKRPRQRICRYLLENTSQTGLDCQLPFSTELVATYLNLARPTLSKELHKMENDGLIEIHRGMVRVLNLEKLYQELN